MAIHAYNRENEYNPLCWANATNARANSPHEMSLLALNEVKRRCRYVL